ncbi:hypothetical protein BpHYR1_015895 [Brachionus plicatilis]|uniref:Uncharacterized protein n=1 Tax=Brachionus plicatilis TaxID=10195 RepID=A0A3M7RT87_BRAPC|nr:hypothetical protein BpHYR1_015895 [Brachionus plicatilis]
MEEIMQMSVLKLFRNAINQLTSKLSPENHDAIQSNLRLLKNELLSINSDITRFASRLSEMHQVQQSIAKAYINHLEEQINYTHKNPSALNELESQMKNIQVQISEIMNERKNFLTFKFEFINDFLTNYQIKCLNEQDPVRLERETPNLVSTFNQIFVQPNQSQTIVPASFRMKKNCDVCSLFGKNNHAIKSRLEKLSLCKKCAIFHDNHKKILFIEDRLNCSCFYSVSECPNKKLEAFKFLLNNFTGFEKDEFCGEPSLVKKRRVVTSKWNDTNNDTNNIITIKTEPDE